LGVGVEGDAIEELELSVRSKYDLSLLAGSGAPVRVAMDRDGRVHALEIELAEGHLVQACRRGGALEVRNIEHAMRADVSVVALTLGSDGLSGAVEAAGEFPELGALVAKQLAYDVDFHTEARPGDRIQMIVEKRYLGPHFHRYGRVLGVRYIGAGGRVAYYRYKPEGHSGGFFDREGRPMRRELLRAPVAWYPVSRGEQGRLPPRVEFVEGRMGAIYSRSAGAPVLALGDGKVTKIRNDAEDGLTLELQVGERRIRYMHLARLFGDIEVGQELRQGQILGLVGSSGRAPSARLRMEISEGEEILDPMIVHNRGNGRPPRVGEPVPENSRERFAQDIRPWSRSLRRAGR
jgi:murein DD-endopeptidase MepM/ murein hydrolase activator NlpD